MISVRMNYVRKHISNFNEERLSVFMKKCGFSTDLYTEETLFWILKFVQLLPTNSDIW